MLIIQFYLVKEQKREADHSALSNEVTEARS